MVNIEIKYDGKWPCLCFGHLEVWIDDVYWDFGNSCLSSGGAVLRDDDWNMWAEEGPWDIWDWPEGFPEELKELVIEEVNNVIPHGCCGGCI